jgi:hypothetical protein
MLAKLQGFDPLRRVLLATPGTLQGTLAAYFGELVDVQMLSQSQDGATFDREVNLVLRDRGIVVCHAVSQITVEDEDFLKMIKEKQIGIGRIAQVLHRETSFLLETASEREEVFMRTYRLEGEGFAYHIHEDFPAALYPLQNGSQEVRS